MKNIVLSSKTLLAFAFMLLLQLSTNVKAQQIIPDPSLDNDGIKEYNSNFYGSAIRSVAQQADGKLISISTGVPIGGSNNVYIITRFLLDGTLDTTFGNAGVVQGFFDSTLCYGDKILMQPDDKILIGGSTSSNPVSVVAVSRLNSDGTLDTTFNGTGTAEFNLTPDFNMLTDMILQPDGKIIIVGYSTNGIHAGSFLLRLLPDATLDTTFNGTGIYLNNNYLTDYDQTITAKLQPDGKIITLGSTEFNSVTRNLLKRFNANGTIDIAFGNAGSLIDLIGIIDDTPGALLLQPDGKIVVAGNTIVPIPGSTYAEADYSIARYNTDGSIDSTFNNDGKLIQPVGHYLDTPTAMQMDNAGNIYIAGYSNMAQPGLMSVDQDMTLIKLDSSGFPDLNFATNGIIIVNWGVQDNVAMDMIIQQDGKFLLAGFSSLPVSGNQMALLRLMPVVPTGINNAGNSFTSTIYPSPFNDQLTVISGSANENIHLSIFDISGKQMISKIFNGNYIFDTSEWSNGFYFYTLTNGQNKITSGKLIKAD